MLFNFSKRWRWHNVMCNVIASPWRHWVWRHWSESTVIPLWHLTNTTVCVECHKIFFTTFETLKFFFFESTVNYPYGTWRTPLCVWSAIRFCFHNFRSIENSFFFSWLTFCQWHLWTVFSRSLENVSTYDSISCNNRLALVSSVPYRFFCKLVFSFLCYKGHKTFFL